MKIKNICISMMIGVFLMGVMIYEPTLAGEFKLTKKNPENIITIKQANKFLEINVCGEELTSVVVSGEKITGISPSYFDFGGFPIEVSRGGVCKKEKYHVARGDSYRVTFRLENGDVASVNYSPVK